ncbi:HNH endonuclease [Streptomyces rubiginosohelvolus]|uniref:HNH endonuclease n=1 Tax=Streptomyces rubiginosohelvolus TaxID=67362 RepID=UPI00379838E4
MADLRKQTDMTQATHACPYCSAPLTNPRRVQCGAPECKRQYRNERQRDFQAKHRAATGRSYSRQYDKPRVKAFRISCAHCGKGASAAKANSRYCSRECFYDSQYGNQRPRASYCGRRGSARWKRAERTLEAAAHGTRGTTRWIAGRCIRCGEPFLRRSSGVGVQHCSKRCQLRDKAARRRAAQAGGAVGTASRYRIHVRDGWTCHICGDPVDRDAVVPDLEAPVLDHVIALAKGGSHSEDNLRTAHFYCNSVKRDLEVGWSALVG